MSHRAFTYMPLRMGDHVFVGVDSIVQAASIGSHVHIGAGVVVGEFAIIKDYVKVLDGSVVPPNMVIPSFSIVGGRASERAETHQKRPARCPCERSGLRLAGELISSACHTKAARRMHSFSAPWDPARMRSVN